MELCASFGEIHLEGSHYPNLGLSDIIKVAFKLNTTLYNYCTKEEKNYFKSTDQFNNYEFVGNILETYKNFNKEVIIVKSGALNFYIDTTEINSNTFERNKIKGHGNLTIDPYFWTIFSLDKNDKIRTDLPNLFYNFKIKEIKKVKYEYFKKITELSKEIIESNNIEIQNVDITDEEDEYPDFDCFFLIYLISEGVERLELPLTMRLNPPRFENNK